MSEIKMENFNTDELVLEIENVIKNGFKKILKNHINRYEMLEETHKQIMSLPSIANELNKNQNNKNFTDAKMINYDIINISDEEDDINEKSFKNIEFENITNITKKLIKEEMGSMEEKLEIMEKKYESFTPLLEGILSRINSINEAVILLQNTRDVKSIEPISTIIAPSIVASSVNENIKLEIEEEDAEDEEEEESDDEEEEESDEEEDDEEHDDEDDDEEESDEEESEEKEEIIKVEIVKEVVKEIVKEEIVKDDDIETEASEEEEEEEEEELFEIEIDDTTYCTNNEDNGFIYELTSDGDVGEKVGYLKEGEPFFYADEK